MLPDGYAAQTKEPFGGGDDRMPSGSPRPLTKAGHSLARAVGRRIKVLVLIPSLEIGGAEMDLVRVLPRLDRDRFQMVVYVLEARGVLVTRLLDAGIEVAGPRPVEPGTSPLSDRTVGQIGRTISARSSVLSKYSIAQPLRTGLKYFISSRPVARCLAQGKFDILHTMSPSAYITGVLANGIRKRRMLVMSRLSLNFYQRKSRLLGVVERLFHHRIDLAIGNSQAILSELHAEGIPDHKLHLVRNGIDVPSFVGAMLDRELARSRLEVSHSALVFTSVANLHPYKGHVDLLDALHQLRDRLPADWVLLASGRDIDGNLGKLRTLACRYGIAKHIHFLGERQDIPAVLSASDIHVSASHYEGFPNNILEAMCAGLPVVATAVGGVPEQIVGGATGLLVPPGSPAALAAALYDLSCDSARRAAMGSAARDRVTVEFSIDRCVAAFDRAYTQLAKARDSRSETTEDPRSAVQ
jgi:glycosyltransferase involved in cell wall biosynthesis